MKKANLKIGNLVLDTPFLLAPLAGITDQAMRSLCARAGASLTYTEMVSAKGLWYGDRKTAELLTIGEEEGSVGAQLFGSQPRVLAHAVRVLAEREDESVGEPSTDRGSQAIPGPPPKPWPGYPNDRRPVLFDLNAGCPVPKIVKNGEGSALLKDPDLLYDCVSAMCDAARGTGMPVTVKIRRGFDAGEDLSLELAKAIQAAGADAITIHGRTRQQFYDGRADWTCIAKVKEALDIPVIGNGDVMTGEDALRMMDETGCDGVMIARGALGNPWIFSRACALWRGEEASPEPTREERIAMLLRHIDLVCADKGEHIAVREMRKHIGWYVKGLPGATRIRRRVNTIDRVDEMKRVIGEMLR